MSSNLIADLTQVNLIKQNIKNAIINKGQTVTNFLSYPGAIENISGGAGGVKLFETVEEMQQDTTAQEGDLAVIYREEIQPVTEESEFDSCTFPNTVVLDEAFSGNINGSFRAVDSSSGRFDGDVRMSSSRFRFDGYGDTMIQVQYTSTDGITYTRTDGGEELQEFGITIKWEPREEFNNVIGNFMKIKGNYFDGIYACNMVNTDNYDIKQINLDGTVNIVDDYISKSIVNRGVIKSYLAFGSPGNYFPKIYIDNNKENLYIYSSGHASLYISTYQTYQNKILDNYSSNVSSPVYTQFCIYNIENDTTTLVNLDIIGVSTVNNYNIVNIPYNLCIGAFHCVSGGDIIVDGATYRIDENNFSIYKTETKFVNGTLITENVGTPITHKALQYILVKSQLDATSDYVYKQLLFYGKNGVENGTLTTSVSNSFADVNAEVYTKIQAQYNNMQPRVLTDQDKTIDKSINIIPCKTDGTLLLDTSKVTDMKRMFYNCKNLIAIPLLDTSKATNMQNMFDGCKNLTTIPLLDTGNVTNMQNMFQSCKNLTTIPLLDTSSVTDMAYMFQSCKNLTTIPLLDTSSVTDMAYMFYNCKNLIAIPLLDTSKATNMDSMLENCTNLTTIPLLDTSSVTDMAYMFDDCPNLTDDSLNIIMQMCINATSYTNTKTLKYIGLTSEQANKCKTLSNYSAFTAAGWTTGY